jgi:hypothetical protein
MDLAVGEIVDAPRGRDAQTDLRQRRHVFWIVSHEPIDLAVHANQADERVLAMGPVAGRVIRQPIRLGPNAEEGIERHQRLRRRPKGPLR